jgi:hypothetical protein
MKMELIISGEVIHRLECKTEQEGYDMLTSMYRNLIVNRPWMIYIAIESKMNYTKQLPETGISEPLRKIA